MLTLRGTSTHLYTLQCVPVYVYYECYDIIVPSVPTVHIVPTYSSVNRSLLKLFLTVSKEVSGSCMLHVLACVTTHCNWHCFIQPSFFITDGIMEAVTKFLVRFPGVEDPVAETACGTGQTCEYMVEVPSSVCLSQSDISVATSAANRLGVGSANETTIGILWYHVFV